MGVVSSQFEGNSSNSIITVAIVDKFGELVAHKQLMRLMPPRELPKARIGGQPGDEDEERFKRQK
jgi:hypothetical protein